MKIDDQGNILVTVRENGTDTVKKYRVMQVKK